VDKIIQSARENDVKLILLWFGTWKNGRMNYAPAWVKNNSGKYRRVITHEGIPIAVLSSHCEANFKADRNAFCKLIKHVAGVDNNEKTVIAVQVENECGILGKSFRDHGPDAEKEFTSLVPAGLVDLIGKKPSSPLHGIWKNNGQKTSGTWAELFGNDAGEIFTANSISGYINGIARAGKKEYDVPMFVNVWLDGSGLGYAGQDFPCGGAVTKTLDLWKWNTPDIDLIAPDNYNYNSQVFQKLCSVYDREDNPLFIPESSAWDAPNAWLMFYAIGKYNCTGFFIFGIENMFTSDGCMKQELKPIADSFNVLDKASYIIRKYLGTGRIHTFVEEENLKDCRLDLDDYVGIVSFKYGRTDFRHDVMNTPEERGRGMLIRTQRNELFAIGGGYVLSLQKKNQFAYAADLSERQITYRSVEEGRFDAEGNWICARERNGDEVDGGIWLHTDVGVVRVVLCD
jgi:hypothetical protein